METKRCPRCELVKPIEEFRIIAKGKRAGKIFARCKTCERSIGAEWRKAHPRYFTDYLHRTGRNASMTENKKCADFLGIHVAERVLSKFFDNIIRMPTCNPGYDFICGKGHKIDVKSSCVRYFNMCPHWSFNIKRNRVANYFLCLAFDDREHLNPIHVWLIPGNDVNYLSNLGIFDNDKSLSKYKIYERPLDKVLEGCKLMRNHE